MWKTLILLWTVNLCLSDSRIRILGENGVHLQKDSAISNEKECRQTCRDSLTTNNLYCSKSLLLNKWCAIISCNRLCHTNEAQMITDPLLSRNYLKRRRKRSPKGASTSKKHTTRSTESDIPTDKTPSKLPATETTRTTETTVKPTTTGEPMPAPTEHPAKLITITKAMPTPAEHSAKQTTTKTMSAPTEHPAKQTNTSTEKAIITTATSSMPVTSTTTTAVPTTRTEPKIVPSKSSSPIILKSTDSVTPKVNVEISTSTDSTSKTIHTSKPLAISITEKPATNKTDDKFTTEQEKIEIKTTPGRIPVLMPTSISNEESVASTIVSPVLADFLNNNTKEPLPDTSAMSTIEEPAPFNTTVLSPATAANTTVATTQTTMSEPTIKLPTTRQTVVTFSKTIIPVPQVTTSSPSETTSTTKPGTLSSSSTTLNLTTSKTSMPESHVLISTAISTVSSIVDGDQKKEDNSIVIVSGEVAKHVQNTSFLLAVLLLGNMFFITIIVLFVLQAYESYKKKDYTQMEALEALSHMTCHWGRGMEVPKISCQPCIDE